LVFIRRPVHPAGEAYATFKKLAPSGKSPAYLHHRTYWEFSPRRDTGRGFSDWRCNDSLTAHRRAALPGALSFDILSCEDSGPSRTVRNQELTKFLVLF